jgi:hypothetical protein
MSDFGNCYCFESAAGAVRLKIKAATVMEAGAGRKRAVRKIVAQFESGNCSLPLKPFAI